MKYYLKEFTREELSGLYALVPLCAGDTIFTNNAPPSMIAGASSQGEAEEGNPSAPEQDRTMQAASRRNIQHEVVIAHVPDTVPDIERTLSFS